MEYLLKRNILIDKDIQIPKKNQELLRPRGAWISIMNLEKLCLFYKVPNETSKGELVLVKKVNKCRDEYSLDVLAQVKRVNALILKSDKKIEMIFSKDDKKYHLKFKFFDKKNESEVVFINDQKIENEKLSTGAICRSYDNNCALVDDLCSQCPNSWFEVIQNKCSNKKIRKCGQNRCGSKGEIACADGSGICSKGLKSQWNDEGILVCL